MKFKAIGIHLPYFFLSAVMAADLVGHETCVRAPCEGSTSTTRSVCLYSWLGSWP